MIKWNEIDPEDCDQQVDKVCKCLVVSLPFDVHTDHHSPEVSAMLAQAVAEDKTLRTNATRARYCEDGQVDCSRIMETVYPHGAMGAPAIAERRATPKEDQVTELDEDDKVDDEGAIDVEATVE
jgi:hypothetical protein